MYPFHPPDPQAHRDALLPKGYIEDAGETRTKLGKERVLTRVGQGGCNRAFFNILLQDKWRSSMQCLRDDGGASRTFRFFHDVLNVSFNGRLGDAQR